MHAEREKFIVEAHTAEGWEPDDDDVMQLSEQARALGYVVEVDDRGWCNLHDAAGNWIDCRIDGPWLEAEPEAEDLGGYAFFEVEAWLAAKAQAQRA